MVLIASLGSFYFADLRWSEYDTAARSVVMTGAEDEDIVRLAISFISINEMVSFNDFSSRSD